MRTLSGREGKMTGHLQVRAFNRLEGKDPTTLVYVLIFYSTEMRGQL